MRQTIILSTSEDIEETGGNAFQCGNNRALRRAPPGGAIVCHL
jgi:hypothetical protein